MTGVCVMLARGSPCAGRLLRFSPARAGAMVRAPPPARSRSVPLSPPRIAIFDLDGTLVDSIADITDAMNGALAELEIPAMSVPELRRMVGDGAPTLCARVVAARPDAPVTAPELTRRFLHHYEIHPAGRSRLYPGTREALAAITDAGIPLALCTNKPAVPTRHVLDALDLASLFTDPVCGDTFAFRKPDPRMLSAILAPRGVAPEHAVLVGDSEVDAATAEAAGVPFVLMTYGYNRGEPKRTVAELDTMADLPRALGLS